MPLADTKPKRGRRPKSGRLIVVSGRLKIRESEYPLAYALLASAGEGKRHRTILEALEGVLRGGNAPSGGVTDKDLEDLWVDD